RLRWYRLTRRAGVAQGTFYNYFNSRQDLFDQLLPSMSNEMLAFIYGRHRTRSTMWRASIPHADAVHCLDWHRRVNTAHLHGFKDDFPSYAVSAFLYLPRI